MAASEESGTKPGDAAARIVPKFAAIVLLPPVLALIALIVWRPADGSSTLLAALGLVLVVAFVGSRFLGPTGLRWILVACSVAVLAWPEVGLRLAARRFDSAGVVRFGWPKLDSAHGLRKEPELFWTLSPDSPDVNSHGFPGPEFEIEKQPGVRRLLFFGDSCTQQGFPALVEQALTRRSSPRMRYEAINLGVAGYSSHQGRVLARRLAGAMQPDFAVVLFGWNDHWLAHGSTDAEKSTRVRARLWAQLGDFSRVLQWLGSQLGREREGPLEVPRVSLEDYRNNLIDIASQVEAAGGRVLVLTAPTAHARSGVPQILIDDGLATSERSVIEQHRAYNDEVRRLAAFRGYSLVDLARDADRRPDLSPLFRGDGIHLTGLGLKWISDHVLAAIAREEPTWFDAPGRAAP